VILSKSLMEAEELIKKGETDAKKSENI